MILVVSAGCAQTGPARQTASSDACGGHLLGEYRSLTAGEEVGTYLELLDRFDAADAGERKGIYEEVTVAAALKASAHHRLRLALLKLSSDHGGYNLSAAETLLESVVADADMLSPGAVSLAASYLRLIKQYNRVESANAELRNQLNDARKKLDALTEIEQAVKPGDEIPDDPPEVPANER